MKTDDRLTLRREQELVVGAEAGDRDASRKLVEAFLPAILGIAGHFPTALGGVERQELVQEGVAGLLFAARRFDSGRPTPFWSYASFWVRKAMQELVAEVARPVALSDRAVRALAQVKAARREYLQANGSEPTDEDLSRATGLTRSQVESLRATERRPRALQEPLGDADEAATVGETIADPVAERDYDAVLDRIEIGEVRTLADELDKRARSVVRAHYGLGQRARTLDEIGAGLGVTAERARQIEADALRQLRERLAHTAVA
jgi:RNA polymerase primary sigma factor